MTEPNVGKIAADMLKKALPGFASRIVPERDAIAIRGALPVAAEVTMNTIVYPVSRPWRFDAVPDRVREALFDSISTDAQREREARLARERVEDEIRPSVEQIVERVRRYAIDAVGLEEHIARREERARDLGKREGYDEGRRFGWRTGRAALLREIREASDALAVLDQREVDLDEGVADAEG